jgi:hypothetical protein
MNGNLYNVSTLVSLSHNMTALDSKMATLNFYVRFHCMQDCAARTTFQFEAQLISSSLNQPSLLTTGRSLSSPSLITNILNSCLLGRQDTQSELDSEAGGVPLESLETGKSLALPKSGSHNGNKSEQQCRQDQESTITTSALDPYQEKREENLPNKDSKPSTNTDHDLNPLPRLPANVCLRQLWSPP